MSRHTYSTVAPLCCHGLDILQGSRLRESQPQQPGRPMPSLSVSMPLIFITLGLYLWTMGRQLQSQNFATNALVAEFWLTSETINKIAGLDPFKSPSFFNLVLSFLVNTTIYTWSWSCTWSTPPAAKAVQLLLSRCPWAKASSLCL